MNLVGAVTVMLLCGTTMWGAQAPWTLNGSAKLQKTPNGTYRLWLTPNQPSQAGSAFLSSPIEFNASYAFSVFFQFQMTDPGYQASDGMTFVLQTEGPTALGCDGGGLGYQACGTNPGITPSIAVEFDDYQNVPYDINDNHVAILTNAQITGIDPQTPYGVTNCQPTGGFGCMNNGDVWSVWIDYDGTSLNVAVSDGSTKRPANLLSYPIDIGSILGQSSAYLGFSAGCGNGYENHYVMNVQFDGRP